jgi:hypothetical protein
LRSLAGMLTRVAFFLSGFLGRGCQSSQLELEAFHPGFFRDDFEPYQQCKDGGSLGIYLDARLAHRERSLSIRCGRVVPTRAGLFRLSHQEPSALRVRRPGQ